MSQFIKSFADGATFYIALGVIVQARNDGRYYVNGLAQGSSVKDEDKTVEVQRQGKVLKAKLPEGTKFQQVKSAFTRTIPVEIEWI